MMASLYQSSSPSRSVTGRSSVSIDERTFMARTLRQAAEKDGGIVLRLDPHTQTAPVEHRSHATDKVLDRGNMPPLAADVDFGVADRQPDLVYIARERDHDSDRIGEIGRLLHECDHIGVIDGDEAQIGRLLQACVLAPDPVDEAEIRLDIAAAVPVARLDLELVGVAILFAAGQRLMFEKLEAVIDAVSSGQGCSEGRA